MKAKIAGSLIAVLMLNASVFAQENGDADAAAEIDALEPAVATSDLAGGERPRAEAAGEVAPVLAQGVTRNAGTRGVMDELELDRTEVTGNQELPKVLYIVPWQKSGPAELMGKPVNTLLDEVLAPIDRKEFVRQVDYYDDLYRGEEE
jgi:hypothetical protein